MKSRKKLDKRLRKVRPDTDIYPIMVRLVHFLRQIRVRRLYLILSITLSFCAALFSATELALLIPLLGGIIRSDFGFIRELPVFGFLLNNFPSLFPSFNTQFLLVVMTVFMAALLSNLMNYLSVLSIQCQVSHANSIIRKMVFNRYLSFGKLFFDRNGIGNLNTVLMSYTGSVARQLKAVQRLLGQIFALAAYTIMILLISWKLTLITLLVFPVMSFLSIQIVKKIRKISKDHVDARKNLDQKIFNILSCIPLVKASAMEENERERFASVSDHEVEESFRMERTVQLITPVQNVTTLVALLVVAFSLNWVIREPGAYQTSAYLVFFFIVRRMVPGFNALNKFAVSLATASGGILPVLDILEDDKEKHIVRGGKRQFRELEQSIEFRDLHFSYYPDTPVIQGVSFSIEKGKTTAIVGPTGAGKTSLIGLILRFYDCPPGSLFLDGVDIREYDVHALRRQMALVSQDVLLFNDTLRSNMLYGYTPNGRDADEAMRQSTEKSCLSDFVAALPNHYDTMIGERGVQLSGGEKQRVSIARAILKGANILLLDEATSSLDSKTERFIQEGIDNAIRGKTAVVIAHRLSTIRHADKVIVIEGGRVVEEGPLEALLAKKGKFFEYWEAQKFY